MSRAEFVQCAPAKACLGHVNVTGAQDASVACSKNYRGERCADCNIGSYRCVWLCSRRWACTCLHGFPSSSTASLCTAPHDLDRIDGVWQVLIARVCVCVWLWLWPWSDVLFCFRPWASSHHRCRLKGTCHTCPNTAWLLFLSFALAIMVFVAVGVWLSKRKINLAGLSIGVVSEVAHRLCTTTVVLLPLLGALLAVSEPP